MASQYVFFDFDFLIDTHKKYQCVRKELSEEVEESQKLLKAAGLWQFFDGENFAEWALQIQALLKPHGLWPFVIEEDPADPEATETLPRIQPQRRPDFTLGLIDNSMSYDIYLDYISEVSSPKEAWDIMQVEFGAQQSSETVEESAFASQAEHHESHCDESHVDASANVDDEAAKEDSPENVVYAVASGITMPHESAEDDDLLLEKETIDDHILAASLVESDNEASIEATTEEDADPADLLSEMHIAAIEEKDQDVNALQSEMHYIPAPTPMTNHGLFYARLSKTTSLV